MQLKDIAPSFGVSIIMAIPVYLLTFMPISYYVTLPLQIAVGAAIVIFLCERLKLEEYIQIKDIVLSYIHRKK